MKKLKEVKSPQLAEGMKFLAVTREYDGQPAELMLKTDEGPLFYIIERFSGRMLSTTEVAAGRLITHAFYG